MVELLGQHNTQLHYEIKDCNDQYERCATSAVVILDSASLAMDIQHIEVDKTRVDSRQFMLSLI